MLNTKERQAIIKTTSQNGLEPYSTSEHPIVNDFFCGQFSASLQIHITPVPAFEIKRF